MQGPLFPPKLYRAVAEGKLGVPRVPLQRGQGKPGAAEEGNEEGIQRDQEVKEIGEEGQETEWW